MTVAKGITNGTVPMGGVFVRKGIYEAFMQGPENAIELFHGYTYSGHPLACAAGLATLDVYKEEGLFERAALLADYWEDGVHSLQGLPNVIDLRNIGLVAGIELEGIAGEPTRRAYDVFLRCYEAGLLVRTTGDIVALSPPLIIDETHIDQIFDTLGKAIKEAA
jgi:beta-alanine--pyruvate transaminase